MLLECKQNPIVQNEIIRVTTAPNLAFQYVLHLATPADRISAVLVEAFKTIENNLGCRSVALPAIGTGKKQCYSLNLCYVSQCHLVLVFENPCFVIFGYQSSDRQY